MVRARNSGGLVVAFALAAATGLAIPASVQAQTTAQAPSVDPRALDALARMNAHLRTLTSFEVISDATVEKVIDEAGTKVTLGSRNTYRVRRPDAFFVESASDRSVRRYYYDGNTFTVFAPRAEFYARTPAPPTIPAALELVYRDFGIAVPLGDVLTWGGEDPPTGGIVHAMRVGYAKVAGVDTDQYLFKGPDLQWQLWIQRGPEPLPRKVVITTLDDPARPTFSADLAWTPRASFGPDAFAFNPPTSARPVALARIGQ